MSREECGHLVMAANHGDFLIRLLPSGDRSICVNDKGSARFYTIHVDPATPGRWLFAGYSHNSMEGILDLLHSTPIKNKANELLKLGSPAPGGSILDDSLPPPTPTPADGAGAGAGAGAGPEAAAAAPTSPAATVVEVPSEVPSTPGGSLNADDEGCLIM